jgi:hypothetical protein
MSSLVQHRKSQFLFNFVDTVVVTALFIMPFSLAVKHKFRHAVEKVSYVVFGLYNAILLRKLQKRQFIFQRFYFQWRMSDSNRPPHACKARALPDELIPQ